jgi:hypothetical protein
METSEPKLLVSIERVEIEDELLQQLAGQNEVEFREHTIADDSCPFDLEVAAPRAVDVAKLYKLWHLNIPPTIAAALGPHFAVLLCHSVTPFYRRGQRPVGVAGLGYTATLEQSGCVTASLFPESKLVNYGKIEAELQLGLDCGGALAVPKETLTLADAAVPGLHIAGASINATTNAQFGIAIQCSFSFIQAQAGPVGAGGARWNIYKKGQRIDLNHTLLHTLLAPDHTKQLHVCIDSWVRQPRRVLGLLKGIEWTFPRVEYDVSLESQPQRTSRFTVR